MKLLLIEDDPELARLVSHGLKPAHQVEVATTGEGGLGSCEVHSFEAVILDVGLPDIGGHEVCVRLRESGNTVPILVLSAEDSVDTKIKLLDSGADDYLTKPFQLRELTARLKVLRRRTMSAIRSNRLTVADLVLDTDQAHVTRAGQTLKLRPKERLILEYLMNHPGQVLTRSMIASYAWNDDDAPWTNAVDVHIKHLRDKIDRPFDTALIKTVYGLGYKLESPQHGAAVRRP